MVKLYLAPLIVAALVSGGLTFYVRLLARRLNLVDWPAPRKIHTKPIPRLGGLAIIITFLVFAIGYNLISHRLDFSSFKIWVFDKRLLGVVIGALVLLAAGIYDDVRGLAPWKKLIFQIIAAVTVVLFGIGIAYIRLPFGYHLNLDSWVIPISIGQGYQFVVWGDLLTIFWIVLLINTLNFLDGLDGLAGGVAFISAVVIFFLSFSLGQGAAALLALIFAGSILGFLPWNFYPAKIFMGDAGSMFLGYLLGVLSVISGGKLATAFLVLGLPVLDVSWVVLRRIFSFNSPFVADKLHFHHRLLTAGLSQRQAVIALYIVSAAFGMVGVFAQTREKIQAIIWLLALMVALALALIVLEWRKRRKVNG